MGRRCALSLSLLLSHSLNKRVRTLTPTHEMGDDGMPKNAASGVEDPCWLRIMELGSLCSLPMALKAAINLNVFEILQKAASEVGHEQHQLSAAEMVARMHIGVPSSKNSAWAAAALHRILRVLASHSILTSSSRHPPLPTPKQQHSSSTTYYGLTPLCKYLIPSSDGASLCPIVLMNQDKVFMDTWHHLHEAVVDGGSSAPFSKAHGTDAFSYGQQDARFDALFNSAMACHTQLLIAALLGTYDGFRGLPSLVDVGGGFGLCLRMIVSKHPQIRGINFDQPHVIAAAPPSAGVQHVGGDMFTSIPQADAIFMKWILHDWNDEHCIVILKNCYGALPSHGKVIVVDSVIPPSVETSLRARVGYQMDLLMFAYNQGGRERTLEEFNGLAKAAGFASIHSVCNLNEANVLEFYKS